MDRGVGWGKAQPLLLFSGGFVITTGASEFQQIYNGGRVGLLHLHPKQPSLALRLPQEVTHHPLVLG